MEVYFIGKKYREAFRKLMSPEDYCLLDSKNVWGYGLVEEQTGTAVGAMVVELVAGIAVIRSLYVHSQYRCHGGAEKLIDSLVKDCIKTCNATEIQMLLPERDFGPTADLASFLSNRGFDHERTAQNNYVISLEKLKEAELIKKAVSVTNCYPLRKVSELHLRRFSNLIESRNDVYVPLPIDKAKYNNETSFVSIQNGEINGILLTTDGGGFINLDYCLSLSKNSLSTVMMFYSAAKVAIELFSPETRLRVATMDSVSSKLCDRILTGAEITHYARYYNDLRPMIFETYTAIYGDLTEPVPEVEDSEDEDPDDE